MIDSVAAFAGGLLGSAHCVGMCGGFVALLGAESQPLARAASRQIVYSLGRVFTYTFLGAVGGFAGGYLSRVDGGLLTAQRAFSIGAGVIMILVGVSTLGILRLPWALPQALTRTAASIFRQFLNAPGRWGVFMAGTANGFLPCGLVYAFLAMAVAGGSPLHGMLIMSLFGAGTIPAMTLLGCGSTLLGHRFRSHVFRLAAVLVIITGGICIGRAWSDDSCCPTGPHPLGPHYRPDGNAGQTSTLDPPATYPSEQP